MKGHHDRLCYKVLVLYFFKQIVFIVLYLDYIVPGVPITLIQVHKPDLLCTLLRVLFKYALPNIEGEKTTPALPNKLQ